MTLDRIGLDVSRETIERLKGFEADLIKWNRKINLISRSTIEDAWLRHIVDSAQLHFRLGADDSEILDIGSGGGLPALVLSILALELCPNRRIHLVESDQRKAAFLRSIVAKYRLDCVISAKRIEEIGPLDVDVVTARALAPLSSLLNLGYPLLRTGGRMIFPKGQKADEEIEEARKAWNFQLTSHPSLTSESGQILELSDVTPKHN